MTDLKLNTGGRTYAGWTRVVVQRAVEQLASGFSLTLAELWTGDGDPIPIYEGQSCEIYAGARQVLSGYIDSSITTYNARQHTLSVQGRSKLGDLVDCSAEVAGGQFINQTLEQIARTLCQPFGVTVVSDRLSQLPIKKFSTQEGETILECLERAAKAEGVLLLSNDQGQLYIPSGIVLTTTTRLMRGVNILTGRREGSWSERFSSYTVKSQNAGTSTHNRRSAAQISGSASDDVVTRTRPLTLVSESQTDIAGCTKRAQWERNVRSARSQRLTYTVRGWDEGGGIWTPYMLVPVVDNFFGVNDTLLISAVTLEKSENGEITTLTLVHPSAFDVSRTPPVSTSEGDFW